MRVSDLAARVGVTAKAIRFYEAEGILPPPSRAANGYREYTDDDLCRVRLVVTLRSMGIGLTESGRLGALCRSGRCEEMAGDLVLLVEGRRRAVAASRAELDHLDAELAAVERALRTGASISTLCSGKEETNASAMRLPVRT